MENLEVIIGGTRYVPVKEENPAPEFNVGDWVIGEDEDMNPTHPCRITDVTDSAWGYDNNGIVEWQSMGDRLATPAEIESYLIAEAERRGFKEGVKCMPLFATGEPHLGIPITITSKLHYDERDGSLDTSTSSGGIYRLYASGKWAEIIKEPRQLPKTVEELEETITEFVDRFRLGSETDIYKAVDSFIKQFES